MNLLASSISSLNTPGSPSQNLVGTFAVIVIVVIVDIFLDTVQEEQTAMRLVLC